MNIRLHSNDCRLQVASTVALVACLLTIALVIAVGLDRLYFAFSMAGPAAIWASGSVHDAMASTASTTAIALTIALLLLRTRRTPTPGGVGCISGAPTKSADREDQLLVLIGHTALPPVLPRRHLPTLALAHRLLRVPITTPLR